MLKSIKAKMLFAISILILLIVGGTALTLYNQSVRMLWKENKIDYFLDFKIGITVYPSNGKDAKTLISRAHHALHTIEASNQFYQIYDKKIYYAKRKKLCI